MAKSDTKEKTKKTPPTPPKRGPRDGEVGVEWLAKYLDLTPATVRMKLRNAGIEKSEGAGAYSWPEAKAKKVAEQIRSDGGDEKTETKGKAGKGK